MALNWKCGNDHVFSFGDENWHHELNQGYLDEMIEDEEHEPVPMYCTECMDSSSLIPL